jgi:hypothetical protein
MILKTCRTVATVAAPALAVASFASPSRAEEGEFVLTDAVESTTVFQGDPISNLYDHIQKWKKEENLPFDGGAWSWWHKNRHSPHDFGYGTPGLRGTYYYYLHFDPKFGGEGDTPSGGHFDVRFRDSQEDRFRGFYESNLWLWEGYVYFGLDENSKIKAGKIWRRFGFDWDDCFYGNVAYFDGWKLDPDWGGSFETKFDVSGVKGDAFAQVFLYEDKVNGSIPGADAESADKSLERPSVVLRAVPTWSLGEAGSLAAGVSAQFGKIANNNFDDENVAAGALDVAWTSGPFKLIGEVIRSSGSRNPANYVTGGASSHSWVWELGGMYHIAGPVTLRANWSRGSYDSPGGEQVLYLVGTTIALTKNIDLYLEYVRWDVAPNDAARVVFEDGFQFVLNWRF